MVMVLALAQFYRHPGIDVVSFTGSTRAGVLISKAAADAVKNVSLELGGKSPNLVFDDCDLKKRFGQGLRSASITRASPAMQQQGCWFSVQSMMRPLKSRRPRR